MESPSTTLRSSGDKDHTVTGRSRLHNGKVDDIEVCTTPSVPPILTVDDWAQPDDPENPYSWPPWKKMYHSLIPTLLAFVISLGISIYPPSTAPIALAFHAPSRTALLGLTLYVIGLASGPLLGSPLSELLGRRAVYLSTTPLFALATLGAGLAHNAATLNACRFLAGFFGGPVMAVGPGSLADMYAPESRACTTAMFALSPFLATAVGPVIGGYLTEHAGWRWTEWTLLLLIFPVYILTLSTSETYKPTILQRRARRQGLPPAAATRLDTKAILTIVIARPLTMLLTEPIVAAFGVYIAFNFAVLYGFLAAVPFVFRTVYAFTPTQQNLPFLAIGAGCLLAVPTAIALDRFSTNHHARPAPEHRLYAAMLGSVGLPVGLFWFGWSARAGTHYIVPVLALVPFAWGNLCVFISAILYMVDTYAAASSASVLAANGALRYAVGGVFPLFAVQMYQGLGTAWASSLLGFVTVGMLPIPWVLYRWGPVVRRRSGYYTG